MSDITVFSAQKIVTMDPNRVTAILYSNFYLRRANSKALKQAEYTNEAIPEGVVKGPDGTPNGDPTEVDAATLKDAPELGTVSGGVVHLL